MKNDIKSKLDTAFAKLEEAQRDAAEEKAVAETKAEAFRKRFLDVRESMIRPAMEEIGQYIRSKGYDFDITASDGDKNGAASIKLTIIEGPRSGFYRPGANPTLPGLSVHCLSEKQVVGFHENTIGNYGGHASGAGEFTLEQLTKDLVQDKVANVLAEMLSARTRARG